VDEDERGEFEWWSARELMPLLGYSQWRRFEDSIDRAKAACQNSGNQVADHISQVAKMISLGKGAVREVIDYHLSRFGAYLVAMNGDPRKPEIAAAQRYFAVQARRAELELPARVAAAEPLPLIRPWGERNSWCAA
jgi:DNA-damage-inducible protein D